MGQSSFSTDWDTPSFQLIMSEREKQAFVSKEHTHSHTKDTHLRVLQPSKGRVSDFFHIDDTCATSATVLA